ncbi:unnamed protein product [Lepeophtheirus salmonis]|uniref:(salmon louse) hypothetical protein n=1 Tax=Lepeophtheirus salmonis TaxID=72036 RepID=A0A7R8CPF5_LEPSM|nr:unnamed protein product [Lepeophtheirus salmonis]CAF2885894.1 unnamed protein product [Lepeophtheirus salmonis]
MYDPEKNMAIYGPQWKKVICNRDQEYNWEVIDKVRASELDSATVPNQIKINAEVNIMKTEHVVNAIIPLIKDSKMENTLSHLRGRGSLKSMFANEESLKILPKLNEIKPPFESSFLRPGVIYDHGDGLKYSENAGSAPDGANVIVGAIFPENYFLPGEFLNDGLFIPGQRMNSVNGEFIPGASVRTDDGTFSFIPGIFHFDDGGGKTTSFTAGQFINDSDEQADSLMFVKGQVLHTSREAKFVEGETVSTADGVKFVAGAEVDDAFVCGTVIDSGDNAGKFMTGQMIKSGDNPLEFISGVMGEINDKPAFIPGQNLGTGFLPGQIVKSDSLTFVPGEVVINSSKNVPQFIPGINNPENEDFLPGLVDCTSSIMMEGKLVEVNKESHFIPGKTVKGKFAKARRDSQLANIDVGYYDAPFIIDGESLSVIHKKVKPKNGFLVRCEISDRYKFVESVETPEKYKEILCGRMECGEEGPKFVAGKIMEINGTKTFIPGKVLEDGVFVPVIEIDGGEKFIPGQIMNDEKYGIPKFVPGQIINTKSGPSFIPGQVIRTDNGLKFVPGEIVETENGAFFVPGQVMDSPSGAKFLPGQIIETEEGPRLLPPDLFGNLEFLVQGFDINSEEARLLLGRSSSSDDMSNLLGGIGGATVSGEALQALAEGFEPRSGNVISKMGDGLDVDTVLSDELLEKYDDPDIRRLLKTIFLSVFLDTASTANLVYRVLEDYVSQELERDLDGTILNPQLKLNPAIEKLIQTFTLRESSDSHIDFEESQFKETLLAYIEESIQGILEEEGIPSSGMENDIKKLIDTAKGLSVDENRNFFARVTALTEGRCNEQFMENLMRTLSSSSLSNVRSKMDLQELFTTLVTILSPRQDLQNGFKQIAISHSITRSCQTKLDDVMHKVELGDLEYVISMLEQALGLAKYLGKRDIAMTITELLSDPIRLEVIKDDPVVKDVLQKILVMREMASIHGTNPDDDTDDDSLKEFVNQSSALIRPPKQPPKTPFLDSTTNKLQRSKSKSMIQRSKSTIMSAKDISMNTFMAMKTNDQDDKTSWLKNFLSESIAEDVPWECSKALILLKEGYQAIVPREASRSILMGEASYTLIDDNGIDLWKPNKDRDNQQSHFKVLKMTSNGTPPPSNGTQPGDSEIEEETISPSTNGHPPPLSSPPPPISSLDGEHDSESSCNVPKRKSRFLQSLRDSEDREEGLSLADTNLDKYRPHNYNIGPRRGGESDDINDIMDFYCNLGSRARALRRLNNYSSFAAPESNGDEYGRERGESSDPDPYQNEVFVGPRSLINYGGYDGEYEPESAPSERLRMSQSRDEEELDENSRFIIDKARSVRSNPVWDEPISTKYDWNSDSFLEPRDPPHNNGHQRPNLEEKEDRDSTLNPKTRDLLNKLKKSTADLEDINSDEVKRPQQRGSYTRYSREPDDYPINRGSLGPSSRRDNEYSSYRSTRYDPEPSYNNDRYEPSSSYYPEDSYSSQMNNRAPDNRNQRMSNFDRPYGGGGGNGYREPSRSGRDPSNSRYNRYSDYLEDEAPPPQRNNGMYGGGGGNRGYGGRREQPARYQDDDDIDTMISDLKRKTTGRDMRAVASRIEGRNVTPPRSYGRYDDRDDGGGRYGGYY